jgi:hypothetical protein
VRAGQACWSRDAAQFATNTTLVRGGIVNAPVVPS